MPMVVVSSETMCCMDCGGFHFLAEKGLVRHPLEAERYYKTVGRYPNITFVPCPNSGKTFKFPDQGPTLAIEV